MDPLLMDVYHEDVGGRPDWTAAVAAGPPWHGAIIKVSEGTGGASLSQARLAAWFGTQWPAIRTVAGPRYGEDFFRGGYHYLRIGLDGTAQAEHYLQRIESAGGWSGGDLWPIVDVERGGGNDRYGKEETIECTTAFARTVRARTGRGVMLYGGSWLAELGIRNKMGCSWLWIPRYTATLPRMTYERIGWAPGEVFAWQYAGDGTGALDGYPLMSPLGKTDISAVTIAAGGPMALDWMRSVLRVRAPQRDLALASPRMVGEDVREVQRKLLALGYAIGDATHDADGIYGPLTAAAVRAFQQDDALSVDGVVGPGTHAALVAARLGAAPRRVHAQLT